MEGRNYNRTIPQLKCKKYIETLSDADVSNQIVKAPSPLKDQSSTDYYRAHAFNVTGSKDFAANTSLIRGMSNFSSIKLGDSRLQYSKSFQQEAYRLDQSIALRLGTAVQEKPKRQNYLDYKEAMEHVSSERLRELQNLLRDKVHQKREQGGSQLRKAFKIFDRQMSGEVNLQAFRDCLRRMNIETTPVETLALFGSINRSCSGKITYYEFVNNFMEVPFDAKDALGELVDKILGVHSDDYDEEDGRSSVAGEFTDEQIQAVYNQIDERGDNKENS